MLGLGWKLVEQERKWRNIYVNTGTAGQGSRQSVRHQETESRPERQAAEPAEESG